MFVIICFSLQPFRELTKVPLIFIHYFEHIQKNSQLSIREFIEIHYQHGTVFDEDYNKDMQLPFKTFDTSQNQYYFLQNLEIFNSLNKVSPLAFVNKLISLYQFLIKDGVLQNTFHPPRIS